MQTEAQPVYIFFSGFYFPCWWGYQLPLASRLEFLMPLQHPLMRGIPVFFPKSIKVKKLLIWSGVGGEEGEVRLRYSTGSEHPKLASVACWRIRKSGGVHKKLPAFRNCSSAGSLELLIWPREWPHLSCPKLSSLLVTHNRVDIVSIESENRYKTPCKLCKLFRSKMCCLPHALLTVVP